ncbi:MAG TPA: hypothetical protein VL485_20340 [Ktedonobacteraceae bacterium]|jgi:hypothetical protein|nr:hypothetical protein [Ktedonobacteraceae bacterium]
MLKYNTRDTVLLSGWLFADLLLGLAIIFFVSLPGSQKAPEPIVKWTVTPTNLTSGNAPCTGGKAAPACTLTLNETEDSQAPLNWSAKSDMGSDVLFSPAQSTLSPGKSVQITVSHFPCQNGSFTFTNTKTAVPLIVEWSCVPQQERLNFHYQTFHLTIHNVNGLMNNDPAATQDIENQVKAQSLLKPGNVGLAVVYDGAPTPADISASQNIAQKIYDIFGILGKQGFAFQRASYYTQLVNIGFPNNQVQVDVYFFQTS